MCALVLCGACDGHVRSFVPRTAARTGGPIGQLAEKSELPSAVSAVAARRGYTQRGPGAAGSDSYEVISSYDKTVENGSVTIKLIRDTRSGAHRVVIIDWPSFVRSAESKAVEKEIQGTLQ